MTKDEIIMRGIIEEVLDRYLTPAYTISSEDIKLLLEAIKGQFYLTLKEDL